MDYNKILEMDNVTTGDCIDGYVMKERTVILSNGKILNFLDKGENELDYWRDINDSINRKNM